MLPLQYLLLCIHTATVGTLGEKGEEEEMRDEEEVEQEHKQEQGHEQEENMELEEQEEKGEARETRMRGAGGGETRASRESAAIKAAASQAEAIRPGKQAGSQRSKRTQKANS